LIAKRAVFTAEYWEKSIDKAIIRWYNGLEPLLPLLGILYIIIARCASFTHGIRSVCLTAPNSVDRQLRGTETFCHAESVDCGGGPHCLTFEIERDKPTYSIFPPPDDIIPKSGALHKATYASREKGEKLAKQVVDRITEIARQEIGSWQKVCTIFEHLKGGDGGGL
jgi:hypothetical protein